MKKRVPLYGGIFFDLCKWAGRVKYYIFLLIVSFPYQEVENSSRWFEQFTNSRSDPETEPLFLIPPISPYFCHLTLANMKKWCFSLLLILLLSAITPAGLSAQCSICTKTAQQLGEQPAKGMNTGIIYLALFPFLIVGYVGYRWYRNNNDNQ